jgi:dTDP-4-amino-4,6-dideoxygalactose transaminase
VGHDIVSQSSIEKFVPFAVPAIGGEEVAQVVGALRSYWLTTKPKTKLFEHEFATAMGFGVGALKVNVATTGLRLALEALDVSPKDSLRRTPSRPLRW